jgi:hypothetical protein
MRPRRSGSRRRGAPTLAKPVHQIRPDLGHFLATNETIELLSTRGHRAALDPLRTINDGIARRDTGTGEFSR